MRDHDDDGIDRDVACFLCISFLSPRFKSIVSSVRKDIPFISSTCIRSVYVTNRPNIMKIPIYLTALFAIVTAAPGRTLQSRPAGAIMDTTIDAETGRHDPRSDADIRSTNDNPILGPINGKGCSLCCTKTKGNMYTCIYCKCPWISGQGLGEGGLGAEMEVQMKMEMEMVAAEGDDVDTVAADVDGNEGMHIAQRSDIEGYLMERIERPDAVLN